MTQYRHPTPRPAIEHEATGEQLDTHKSQLSQLAIQIDDSLNQACFIVEKYEKNKLHRQQVITELEILVAELWDCQTQINTMLGNDTGGNDDEPV